MRVFGIVVSYRSEPEVTRVVEDLLQSGLIAGVVIVDNSACLGDQLPTFVGLRSDDRVFVLAPSENLGYARGNNHGVRFAQERGADHVLIMNPDVHFDDEDLAALLARHNVPDSAPIISPSLREGGVVLSRPGFDTRLGRGLLAVAYGRSEQVPTFFGAIFLARTQTFLTLGALDEDLFLYCEEVAFVLRGRGVLSGPLFEVLDEVVFSHGRGGTISPSGYELAGRSMVAYEESARSVVIVGRKYFRSRLVLWILARGVLACTLAPRNPRAAVAVLRGVLRGLGARLTVGT